MTASSASRNIMVLDGCFRAQLSRIQVPGKRVHDDCPTRLQFNTKRSDLVKSVHMEYLRAGANVIRTNTYWASEIYMKTWLNLSPEESVQIIRQSVLIARDAVETYIAENPTRNGKYEVIGSCGSATNTIHLFQGKLNRKMLKDFHRLRVQTLLESGVDALAFESIQCAEEAYAVMELLQEFPNSKAWLSFRPDGYMLTDRSHVVNVGRNCYHSLPSQLVAIGVNCTHPLYTDNLIKSFNMSCEVPNLIPLVVYPKKCMASTINGGWNSIQISDFFHISEWVECGIRYIGGCCNVLPRDITIIRDKLDTFNRSP